MKTGKLLKKQFKLDDIDKVYISMVYRSNPITFIVFYNSARPSQPLTKTYLRRFSRVSLVRDGTNELDFSPLINIEQFGGNARGLFIIYDIAYSQIGKRHNESIQSFYNGKLNEYVTLNDLFDKDNISQSTMKYRKERNKAMGTENTTAKLIDCIINKADDSVTFQFLTESTDVYAKDYKYGEVDPKTLKIKRNPSKTYELSIKILEFFDWLSTHPEGQDITRKDIKDILEVSNAQVFSTSPSFQYQGFNYWDTQLDASIYPTNIAPTQWNKIHGDGQAFLDKHLYGLIRSIQFFLNPMASMLTKKLKDRGYL